MKIPIRISSRFVTAAAAAACLLTAGQSFGQIIDGTSYPFTESSGASLEDMTGATKLISFGADDMVSAVREIGFDFWYNGTRYNSFYATPNGALHLGGIVGTNTNVYTLGSGTNNPYISAYGDDGYVTPDAGNVSYKVSGTAPNRKLVVQWSNMAIPMTFGTTPANPQTNAFQAVLSESTGLIEIIHGSGTPANANQYGLGLSLGSAANNYASVTVGGPSTVSYTTLNNANTVAIPAGTKFTFTPRAATAPTAAASVVTGTSVQLNWANTLSGFFATAIYISEDNVNFRFLTQVASPATTFTVTGLGNNSTYYFRVHGVTEGGLSAPLAITETTTAGTLSGIQSVGASVGAPFDNLTNAFAHIQANGLSGNYTLRLAADYDPNTETYPLNVPARSGPGARLTVDVASGAGPFNLNRTAAAADATAGSVLNNTMNLNGSSYVTIDGGASKAIQLTCTPLTTNPNTCALLLINDARDNTIQNVRITGGGRQTATTNVNASVIIAGTTGIQGNDRNTLSGLVVDGASSATNGIVSINPTLALPTYNDGTTITGCEVFDYFETGTGVINRGIFLGQGNNKAVVSNNKVYQTATRTFVSAGAIHGGIVVDSGGTTINQPTAVTINGNTIGYASNAATGTWTYAGTVATRFIAINVLQSMGVVTIDSNTISNISLSSSSGATTAPGVLTGISTGATVGNGRHVVTNNVIGATDAENQMTVTASSSLAFSAGINVNASGTLLIDGNTVRGLSGLCSAVTGGSTVAAITYGGTQNECVITDNVVGSPMASTDKSIRAQGTGNAASFVSGIRNNGTFPRSEVFIENNLVQSLYCDSTNTTANGSRVSGIEAGRGYLRVRDNVVRGLTSLSNNAGTLNGGSVIGLNLITWTSVTPTLPTDQAWGNVITGNEVYDLNTNPTVATTAVANHGILYAHNAAPTGATSLNVVGGNIVTDMSTTATGTAVINAIYNAAQASGAVVDTVNNYVSVGQTAPHSNTAIFGLRQNGNVGSNYFHNSVYIGGTTSVGASGATTAAFLRSGAPATGTTDVRNNALFNARTNGTGIGFHVGLFYNASSSLSSSNFNQHFGLAGANYGVAVDNVTILPDLASWQAVAGTTDEGGFFGNPGFRNPDAADLSLFNCTTAGNNAVAAIAGVGTDLEGGTRPGPNVDIGADEESFASGPAAQVTGLTATALGCTGVDVAFTGISGKFAGYVVVRRAGSPEPTPPSDLTTYTVGNTLGGGTIAYVGSGTSFTDTVAGPGTYHYTVYTYDFAPGCERYNVTSAPSASATTAPLGDPTAQPTNLAATGVTCTAVDVAFDAASPAPSGGYLVVRRAGSAEPTAPTDGTTYNVGDTLGSGTVAFIGSGTAFSDTGLAPTGANWFYSVYSFNDPGPCVDYRAASPLTGNAVAAQPAPTAQATSFLTANETENSIDVSWVNASPVPSGYVVLRQAGSAVTDVPVNGSTYTAGNTIGAATVAYVGSGTSFTDSGLADTTTFHYAIFSLSTVGGCDPVYLTASPLTGTGVTDAPASTVRDWRISE